VDESDADIAGADDDVVGWYDGWWFQIIFNHILDRDWADNAMRDAISIP
jgi:hypothetical protein